jgi:hypothetical protein
MATKKAKGTHHRTSKQKHSPLSQVESDLLALIGRIKKGDKPNPVEAVMRKQAQKDILDLRAALRGAAKNKTEEGALTALWGADNFHDVPHQTYRTCVSLEATAFISGLRQVPGDRRYSRARIVALRRSMRHCLLPFRWAVAVVRKSSGEATALYRLDGNHSSILLRDSYELLNQVPELLLTVFECAGMEEVRRAYQSFNLKQSGRTLRDLIVVEYHGIPRLASTPIAPTLLQALVSGMVFDEKGLKWDQVLPQNKLTYIARNVDFIEWAAPTFKGYSLGGTKGGIRRFLSAPVVAAIYRAWCLTEDRHLLQDIVRRMVGASPASTAAGKAIPQSALTVNPADPPEVQCSHIIQLRNLNSAKALDSAVASMSYTELYDLTAKSLWMALHWRKGSVVDVKACPWTYPF